VLTYDDIPPKFNLASHFVDRNLDEGNGERTALRCGGQSLTYAELARLMDRVGNMLRDLGVKREQRVFIALSDSPEFVATWYAVLKIGAVVADVYTFLRPKDYEYYLNYSRAEVAVVDLVTLENVRAAAANCPELRSMLVVGATPYQLRPGEFSFSELVEAAPDHLEQAAWYGEELGRPFPELRERAALRLLRAP